MQFSYALQCGHGLDVVVIQSVSRVKSHSGFLDSVPRVRELLQERDHFWRFGISPVLMKGMRVRSSMNFADGESHFGGGINLLRAHR